MQVVVETHDWQLFGHDEHTVEFWSGKYNGRHYVHCTKDGLVTELMVQVRQFDGHLTQACWIELYAYPNTHILQVV